MPSVTISQALEADLDALVEIFIDALEPDLIIRFMFSERRTEAIELQKVFYKQALLPRFISPTNRCYISKATESSTGEIVGWSLVRWEENAPKSHSSKAASAPPADHPQELTDQSVKFQKYYWAELGKMFQQATEGQKYAALGSLYVSPNHQGKGIGTKLLEYAFEEYGLDKEKVFLQTSMLSGNFYHRLGWKEVARRDVDLKDWGGKNRGFGLHTTVLLCREPAPFRAANHPEPYFGHES